MHIFTKSSLDYYGIIIAYQNRYGLEEVEIVYSL